MWAPICWTKCVHVYVFLYTGRGLGVGSGWVLPWPCVDGSEKLIGNASCLPEATQQSSVYRCWIVPDRVFSGKEESRDGLQSTRTHKWTHRHTCVYTTIYSHHSSTDGSSCIYSCLMPGDLIPKISDNSQPKNDNIKKLCWTSKDFLQAFTSCLIS